MNKFPLTEIFHAIYVPYCRSRTVAHCRVPNLKFELCRRSNLGTPILYLYGNTDLRRDTVTKKLIQIKVPKTNLSYLYIIKDKIIGKNYNSLAWDLECNNYKCIHYLIATRRLIFRE